MAMYELVPSTKFKKDLKVCLKRGCRKEDRQKSIKLIGLVRTGRHQDLFDE